MRWLEQFDGSYEVPSQLSCHPGLSDITWRNDACPSFGIKLLYDADEEEYVGRVWVEHPNIRQRENPDYLRFCVTIEMGNGWVWSMSSDEIEDVLNTLDFLKQGSEEAQHAAL